MGGTYLSVSSIDEALVLLRFLAKFHRSPGLAGGGLCGPLATAPVSRYENSGSGCDSVTGMETIESILAFWFGMPDDPGFEFRRERWFGKDEAFDAEIRKRFFCIYEQAVKGKFDHWRDSVHGCLALILVFDQFPRNMLRDSPKMFATDQKALALACHAVDSGFDISVPPAHRTFFYLPFEHSECLDDQRQAVDLFRRCDRYPGSERSLDYAIRHFMVIRSFGRFPHRNEILGRKSTPREITFLETHEKGF